MSVYVCGCLNVKIHAQDIHPLQDVGDDDSQPFLSRKVAEVVLDDQGITIEQSYLLHRESSSSGWVQYQCVNCSWRTHAIRSAADTNTVLVNLQLESDPAVLLRRTHSSDFSPAFNIVLQHHDLANIKIPEGPVYESLESGVNHIQEQLNTYLEQERAAMEDRIRNFEQEQRSLFAQLRVQCEKEKSEMISLVVKSATQEIPQLDTGDLSVSSESEYPSPGCAANSKPKPGRPIKTRSYRSYSQYDQNPDSEALFYLDELEPELEEPFYESAEEDIVSGKFDGNTSNNRISSDGNKMDSLMYSTSVPISVPMWRGRKSSSTEEDDEEEVTPSDPDQMAANMQALAESITDTGRYIFGERPRPRLNTGDGLTLYSEHPRRRLNTAESINRRK